MSPHRPPSVLALAALGRRPPPQFNPHNPHPLAGRFSSTPFIRRAKPRRINAYSLCGYGDRSSNADAHGSDQNQTAPMALTETFYRRYKDTRVVWFQDQFPPDLAKVIRQAVHILFNDVAVHLTKPEDFWKSVHNQLVRELGTFELAEGRTFEERCGRFLAEPYDLWRGDHGDMDYYFKTRLSLIELALREFQNAPDVRAAADRRTEGLLSWVAKESPSKSRPAEFTAVLESGIAEMNARFREARVGFAYHAGHIQKEDDPLTSDLIEKPFWELLNDNKWKNVHTDIKEAIDRRDNWGRDAALYALKALESAIKIVSDERGFTRGSETGAANYVDNLVSAANGRIIEVWESEQLKALFRHLRNPHSHGPGTADPPSLSQEQQSWVIESSMAWIKSLVRRL
jgi:hypothetical protein